MPSDEQIDKLVTACSELLESQRGSNERLVRLEVNNEATQKALLELLESQKSLNQGITAMTKTTIKMEGEISRIEQKLLDQIKYVKKDYDTLIEKSDKLEGRVYILEIADAGERGAKEAAQKFTGWFSKNWFNLIKTVFMLSTGIGVIIFIYSQLKGS